MLLNLYFKNIIDFFYFNKIVFKKKINNFFFKKNEYQIPLISLNTTTSLNCTKEKKFLIYNKKILLLKNKFSINNNFFFFLINRAFTLDKFSFIFNFYFEIIFKKINYNFFEIKKKTFGQGFDYIKGLFIIFIIDSSITDDEPLWEPLEWSLFQTWIFFIFIFAWIAENLISSRYGSYTGRDKRVWAAWFKTFWLLELLFSLSYGTAAIFVIVPFYYELTYSVSFVFSWWNWYNRIFFFKFISVYSLSLLIAFFLQINNRWYNWKKSFFFIILINFFIAYLFYTNFIMTFFGYFTDPIWYQKTRFVDLIQLSHEPLKWGWGPAKRDHFSYHKVSTVFWFKNDGPFAGAFLMIHLFFFLSIFFLYLFWLTLLRKTYFTKEVTYTFLTYCVAALKQFFYFFFLFFALVIFSYFVNYLRFPMEFLWIINANSWFINFFFIIYDYLWFLISLFFRCNVIY